MIDPQIWRNEKFGKLSDAGRLLFIGIFSQADDDGRLKASPRFLMANIFPYDTDKTEDEVKHLRDQCAELGLIRLYSNDKGEYLDLPGWFEHQQIRKDRYEPSKLPPISEAETSVLNQPIGPPTSDKEHALQHTLAQRLRSNEWNPTGEKIIKVETNKRLANLYADIVALTETQKYILIETKSYALQPKDLGQVIGYRREMERRGLIPITTFLIGGGLGKLTLDEAKRASVKLLNYPDLLVATTNQSVKATVETTDIPNIIKSSLVKSSLSTPKGGGKKPPDPRVNEIFEEMRSYLGYPEKVKEDPIPSYGKEGQAIKRMLTRGFTHGEIVRLWKEKVSQRGGEFISMVWVNEDIGKKGGAGGVDKRVIREQPQGKRPWKYIRGDEEPGEIGDANMP